MNIECGSCGILGSFCYYFFPGLFLGNHVSVHSNLYGQNSWQCFIVEICFGWIEKFVNRIINLYFFVQMFLKDVTKGYLSFVEQRLYVSVSVFLPWSVGMFNFTAVWVERWYSRYVWMRFILNKEMFMFRFVRLIETHPFVSGAIRSAPNQPVSLAWSKEYLQSLTMVTPVFF